MAFNITQPYATVENADGTQYFLQSGVLYSAQPPYAVATLSLFPLSSQVTYNPTTGTISAGGAHVVGLSNRAQYLPRLTYGLAQMAAGVRNARIIFMGDSTTIGFYGNGTTSTNVRQFAYPNALASQISPWRTCYTQNSLAFAGLASGAAYTAFDPRWTFSGGWVLNTIPGLGGFFADNNNTFQNATFTPGGNTVDTVDIYYLQNTGYGSIAVSANGGSTLSTIACAGTISMAKATVSLPSNTTSITLTTTTAGGTQVYIAGISAYRAGVKGIELFAAGSNGGQTSNAAAHTNVWDPSFPGATGSFGAYGADCVVISLGINDWYSSASPVGAASAANIAFVVAAAEPYADIVFLTPVPSSINGNATYANQLSVLQNLRALCQQDGIPIADANQAFGPYTLGTTNGLYLPANDVTHPGPAGYALMAAVANTVLGL